MTAIELHVKTDEVYKPAGVWYCSKCRIVSIHQATAEQCCQPRICERCDNETWAKYRSLCEKHEKEDRKKKEQEKLDRAKLLPDWDGWIYCEDFQLHNEGYFADVGELLEYIDDYREDEGLELECPKFVYATTFRKFQLDADEILESEADHDHHEDIRDSLIDEESLYAFIKEWNAKQTAGSYYPDEWYKVAVPIREESK